MPLNQDQDHEEQRVRLHLQLPESHIPEAVTRNARGQSLDDARETFRAEWQVKIDRKRHQAAWNRRRTGALVRASRLIRMVGFRMGAIIGALYLGQRFGFAGLLDGLVRGACLGLLVSLSLAILCKVGADYWRRHAKRLEREVREMERS